MDIRHVYCEVNSAADWIATFIIEYSGKVLWIDAVVVHLCLCLSVISSFLTLLVVFILNFYECSTLLGKKKDRIWLHGDDDGA